MSELMAMLTPGAPGFDAVRSTSNNSITPNDVAACLVTLDRLTYLYSLQKFALDTSCRSELNNLAVQEAFDLRFKLSDRDDSRMVAILALTALEVAINPNKCNRCKGVGELKLGPRIEVCESCKGAGQRSVTERNLAKILNTTRFRARKVWKKRLNLLISKYAERDEWINVAILSGLRDPNVNN